MIFGFKELESNQNKVFWSDLTMIMSDERMKSRDLSPWLFTNEENSIVARVIFSEASPICSDEERVLIASVIKNRVGHIGFGKLDSMEKVVLAKNQFFCVNDEKNTNWNLSEFDILHNEVLRKVWIQCRKLSTGGFTSESSIVYYHDKSIEEPKSWDNRYWSTELRRETEHFKFYAIYAKNLKEFEEEKVYLNIKVIYANREEIVL